MSNIPSKNNFINHLTTDSSVLTIADRVNRLAMECGLNTGFAEIGKLTFYSQFRDMCAVNTCRCYGSTWACPPGVGTLEECISRVKSYDKMLVFSRVYQLEDSFDFEGMTEGQQDFRKRVAQLAESVKELLPKYLMLANGGCKKCETCTYPDSPCRFPDQIFHSMSGYAFNVSKVAKMAGLTYNNGPDTVTYFGAIFFHE